MARQKPSEPPRPIAVGDIVAAFSDALGEWTAAQITHIDVPRQKAAVLHLDWSGPEPTGVADLGEVAPLRLTHHSWNGRIDHTHYDWVLPRSYKVIGTLPLLHSEPSNSYGSGWRLGDSLARQRRWDSGDREPWSDPHVMGCTGAELNRVLDEPAEPRRDIRGLSVTRITSLDCDRLVERFPGLTELSLSGGAGTLSHASGLNRLTGLKRLSITNLFGMTKGDRLLPRRVTALESVVLHSIPAEYAAAMRATWRPEAANGTYVNITAGRNPEWVAENLTNPLRDWDGRHHISRTCYRRSIVQYKATRRAVMDALPECSEEDLPSRLHEIGSRYGQAFNEIDARTGFIETVEREELFEALDFLVTEAETALGRDLTTARESLAAGVDSVRDW